MQRVYMLVPLNQSVHTRAQRQEVATAALPPVTDYSNTLQHCTSLEPVVFQDKFGEPPAIVSVHTDFFVQCRLQGRLVLNIHHTTHQLKTQKFFMALRGRAVINPAAGVNKPTGNQTAEVLVYFYQDLSEINLFVFFSCFFSGFFLVLGVTIFLWKVRSIYRLRVLRAQAIIRRHTMANRPFLQANIVWRDRNGTEQLEPSDPSASALLLRRKLSAPSLQSKVVPSALNSFLAVQPTADRKAAVVTTFIRLPGSSSSTEGNLMLASALAQCRPSDNMGGGLKLRAHTQMSSMSAQLHKPWLSRRVLRINPVNNVNVPEN